MELPITGAKHTFNKADYYIWTLTRGFIQRRHPKKSWKWIKDRYFKDDCLGVHQDNYILTDPDNPEMQLQKMSCFFLELFCFVDVFFQ